MKLYLVDKQSARAVLVESIKKIFIDWQLVDLASQ